MTKYVTFIWHTNNIENTVLLCRGIEEREHVESI